MFGVKLTFTSYFLASLVGAGFSSFEVFLINHDVVPSKIPSSAVRRIVQFVKWAISLHAFLSRDLIRICVVFVAGRPMFLQDGISYVLGCMIFSTIYMARYQKIQYKRVSSAPVAATKSLTVAVKASKVNVEEESWRILEVPHFPVVCSIMTYCFDSILMFVYCMRFFRIYWLEFINHIDRG
jgi:hypothetical protein